MGFKHFIFNRQFYQSFSDILYKSGINNKIIFDAINKSKNIFNLKTLKRGRPNISKTLKLLLAESEIAALLEKLSTDYPKLSIGSYPFVKNGEFGVNIEVRGDSSELIDQQGGAAQPPQQEAGEQGAYQPRAGGAHK